LPCFAERAQSLPFTARVLPGNHADVARERLRVEKTSGIAYEDVAGQRRDRPDTRMGHEQRRSRALRGHPLDPLVESIDLRSQVLIQRLELAAAMRGMGRQR
jgi:hypothetical protein